MIRKITCMILLVILLTSTFAFADNWYNDNDGYFTITDENGQMLFIIASTIYIGDEYISASDDRYRIVEVDNRNYRAAAKFIEHLGMIKTDNKDSREFPYFINYLTTQLASDKNNRIGIYCTHTDESYVPTDGTESEPESGGILDVAKSLEDALTKRGCEVARSETPHEPHDAGAYRRSRQTAVELMKDNTPAILIDIHRDAVPPEVYEEEIDGKDVSKVRIVVGATNQNKSANEDFARKIKKIADEKYPDLIKDIYIGKGNYNQDLMPQALLFELGTHTIKKERAQESAVMLADVIATSMGIDPPDENNNKDGANPAPKNQGEGDTKQKDNGTDVEQQQSPQKPEETSNNGIWKSILIIFGVITTIGIILLFVFNSKGERAAKFKGFFRELTGIGKRHNK